ncbi:hypothetical protein CEUSTIGMA_g128.t1 [Chlamydomonas eustigma]|uniref:Conserved oligomeric Golgi complex subunit 3 n=1 Tax=Chlamydomonas eustigma TaxID=1157962 RepID=A0A250WPT6_9CHLO|nr:hypothetical protein CEUSTIGMA_g128.t1 [Chlamydomonas eustigma]|eukprot:GAX72672.1 hypothetical protein CEUSTIGMA_g128.t1 [Chlamydomonas eustigma]
MSSASTPPIKSPALKTHQHLVGAASRSYNVASIWEKAASLSEEELRAIEYLNQACSKRGIPENVADDRRSAPLVEDSHTQSSQPKADTFDGTLEEAVLRNTNQFHKWHTELEAACASEMEEKYKRYADLLNNHSSSCENILSQVQQTLDMFELLLSQHRELSQRSKSLYSSCEQIMKEKEQLEEFADALRAKLRFFDEFESVYAQFNQAQLSTSVDNEQFLSLLKKLDDCKSYVATNPQYADSGTYMAKFRQLQSRAMGVVRSKVQAALKIASQQVQAAIAETAVSSTGRVAVSNGAPLLAEGAEVSLLYVRFRAAAEPSLKGLFREIDARSVRPEYLRLKEECQSLYCQARLQLISPYVQQRVQALASQALPLLARNGCEHLLRVGQLEAQLFDQFFGSSPTTSESSQKAAVPISANGAPTIPSTSSEQLIQVMEPLCTVLYDVLRPLVVQLQEVDELCELVDILKHEVLGDQLKRKGPSVEALVPTLSRTLADVQARLIFRCQAFIKEEVSSFQPSAEDLDFPGKLQRAVVAADAENLNGYNVQESVVAPEAGQSNGHDSNGVDKSPGQIAYTLMYLPVQSTLMCLSKLYRAVDARIFSGLAQEAVSACTLSIQQAARMVAQRAGPLDAQLFTIRHLLFLREQIAPFDVEFSASDIDLDFSHMRDHMRRILSGEVSLFALSSSNAVVKMLGTGGPRVLHYRVDSKKELEKQLKGVCEAVIMAMTKVAVEPMLGFITKVTAVRVAAAANPATAKPIREQAFASPSKLAEMVQRVNEALGGSLPLAVSRMKLYLPNPSTHAILFRPVKSNLVEAHNQVANLLKSEYTAEEVASVPLKDLQELTSILDAMN